MFCVQTSGNYRTRYCLSNELDGGP